MVDAFRREVSGARKHERVKYVLSKMTLER